MTAWVSSTLTSSPGRVLCAVLPGAMLALLDGTLMNLALPELVQVSRSDLATMGWVLSAYNLAFLLALLPLAQWADRYGRRRVVLWSLILLGISSLGGALSAHPGWMIGMRILQGIAGAGITAIGYAVALGSVPQSMRARIVSGWSAASALVIALGPLLGGLLTMLSWRWLFLINLPICVISLLTILLVVPEQRYRIVTVPDDGSQSASVPHPGTRAMYGLTHFLFSFALMGVFVIGSLAFQQEHHMSAWHTGLLLLPISLFASLSASLQEALFRTWPPSWIHHASLLALFLLAGALWSFPWLLELHVLLFAVSGCALGAIIGTLMASFPFLFFRQVPQAWLGKGSALLATAQQLGYTLGVMVLLHIVTSVPGRDRFIWAWLLAGGASMLGFLVLVGSTKLTRYQN